MRLLVPALLSLILMPAAPALAAGDQCAAGSTYARPGGYCEQLAGGSLSTPSEDAGSRRCFTLRTGGSACQIGTTQHNGQTVNVYVVGNSGPYNGYILIGEPRR